MGWVARDERQRASNRREYLFGYVNPAVSEPWRSMRRAFRATIPARAGMAHGLHRGRHLVGHLLDRLVLPEPDHMPAGLSELAVVATGSR
jgi:hypothetical protein